MRLSLRRLDGEARSALADLLGAARLPAATSRLPVSRLMAALGLEELAHLRAAVEAIRGPIEDRRAARRAAAAERVALWSWFEGQVAAPGVGPAVTDPAGWAARVRAGGIRGGVERHRQRLEGVLTVLRRLPADGVTLAALAADALGDPHRLDRASSVAALVLDALSPPGEAAPRDAEAVRDAWERWGVAPDALSSSVLVLGLRSSGSDLVARFLADSAEASQPVVLTLAQLRRWPVAALDREADAFVVENPSVLSEAARRGWSDHPALVCSSGRPSVAVVTLLRQLAAAGATIRQHADFDSAGLAITAWLADRAGTVPWRMSAEDYRPAASRAQGHVPLAGPLPPTPWDPALRPAMAAVGTAVYEEQLRSAILDAIAASGR